VLRQERAPGWEEEAKRLRVALEDDNALVERALRRRVRHEPSGAERLS
jgi:hypothetical protein